MQTLKYIIFICNVGQYSTDVLCISIVICFLLSEQLGNFGINFYAYITNIATKVYL